MPKRLIDSSLGGEFKYDSTSFTELKGKYYQLKKNKEKETTPQSVSYF